MTYEQIIQKAGKRITPRIYYYENGVEVSLPRDDFQQAKFKYNASLVGTVMNGLELETKTLLPDTEIFIEITASFNEYVQKKVYGGYLRRNEPEYNADSKTYSYEMYDKIITAMVKYKPMNITYPTTLFNYFKQLVNELKFTTDITSLPNGSQVIEKDIYDNINYTYRDILTDIGEASGTLFIIEGNKIKKCVFGTSEKSINDDILKNQNITLGKHYGPINTIVLSRSGNSDNIYYPKTLPSNPIEFRIVDNQLMNENNRDLYLEGIYNQLKGIEFDVYDTALVGYGGFEPLSKVKFVTGGKEYNSYVFNNEITITQGYEEVIYTEMPTETEIDYTASDSTDRRINQVYIIARKNEKEIQAVVDATEKVQKELNPTGNETGATIILEDASNNPLTYLEVEGKSAQETRSGINQLMSFGAGETSYFSSLNNYKNSDTDYWKAVPLADNWVHIECDLTGRTNTTESYTNFFILLDKLPNLKTGTIYTLAIEFRNANITAMSSYLRLGQTHGTADAVFTSLVSLGSTQIGKNQMLKYTLKTYNTFASNSLIALRNFHVVQKGDKFSYDVRLSVLEGDYTATNYVYEPFGVSPSPDYPSEIESVGYENLLKTIVPDYTAHEAWTGYGDYKGTILDNKIVLPNRFNAMAWQYDDLKVGESYTFCFMAVPTADVSIGIGVNVYKNCTEPNSTSKTYPIKVDGTMCYFTFVAGEKNRIAVNSGATDGVSIIFSDIQLVEGTKKHSYIAHGKYGVEVETTGINKFDYNDYTYVNTILSTYIFVQIKDLKPNTIYSFYNYNVDGVSTDSNNYGAIYLTRNPDYNSGVIGTGATMIRNGNNKYSSVTFTTGNNGECYLGIYCVNGWNQGRWDNAIAYFKTAMFTEGTKQHPYISYQKNRTTVIMGEPLRSLPNGIKDIAYIKNDKLYVDRYVGRVVLNGSEDWLFYPTGTDKGYKYYISIDDCKTGLYRSMCSHFKNYAYAWDEGEPGDYSDHPTLSYKYFVTDKSTVQEFKFWLATHNIEVQYELATPVTEELGEIEMLKTLKGYNNISTTDKLLPIINLTYVKDTIIADYVENHVAELKLTEKEIKLSVEKVSSSVDGLSTTINRVEETTDDNSKIINIISTNIDKTTGEVREITTTNGFKFNSQGLNIYTGENSYNTLIDNVGTYYKDGKEIISQTTKDGSLLKNLKMQGQTQYSFDGDGYDFLEERVDIDGEYCYAMFYNGEE